MRYHFSDSELEDLWLLAGEFQGIKDNHKIQSNRIAAEYEDREMHYVNLKATHAAATILDRPYNRSVLVTGRKEAPIFLEDNQSIRVYVRQADLSLYDPPDSDFVIMARPLRSIRLDPYVKSMKQHGYRNIELLYCTRETFKKECKQAYMRGEWKWMLKSRRMRMNIKEILTQEIIAHQPPLL